MGGPEKQTPGWSRANAATEAASTAIISAAPPVDKTVANLRAQLALKGHELYVIQKGERTIYEIRRWGLSRTCSTLHDLQAFVIQIGGAA